MRVIVCGSRNWDLSADVAESIVLRMIWRAAPNRLTVVVGGCPTGIDRVFEVAARECGADVEVHEARWQEEGKAAGPKRNQRMVDLGADICVGFSEDLRRSKGTSDCLSRALAAGIPVYLIDSEEASPRRIKTLADLAEA